MFYAPEILSRKNGTELSLVYYLSTTRSLRRVSKKEILELDFDAVLEQIRNPKTPFALRLYSYLLQGLVKIWIFKVDFCISKMKKLLILPRPRASRAATASLTSHRANINIQVREDWISEVEDSGISSNVFLKGLADRPGGDFSGLEYSLEVNHLQNPLINGLPHVGKRTKIDWKTVIDLDHQATAKETRISVISIPDLIECHALEQFHRIGLGKMSQYDLVQDSDARRVFGDIDDMSVEDPRITSSLSQEKDGVNPHKEISRTQSKALWFYNVLVSASRGELVVLQEKPFGKLTIRHN